MGSSETKHEVEKILENDEPGNATVVESEYEIWLPHRLNPVNSELNEDDRKTLFFCRAVTAILNKLTPDNFPFLSGKMKKLPIDSPDRMQRVVEMIHAKAIRESKFCALYAELCDLLGDVEIVNEVGIVRPFYLYLIEHCRAFFQNSLTEDFKFDRRRNEINLISDLEIKKSFMKTFEQNEFEFQKNSVGNCTFISELFKVYMIHPKIIFQILDRLLKAQGNMAIECACSILTKIGFFYEEKIGEFPTEYLNKLESLLPTNELSSRVRFMIQDVLDLKKNGWRFRRQLEFPKTSQQIEQEFIEEEKSRKLSESMSHLKYTLKQNKRKDRRAFTFHQLNDWTVISKHFFKYVRESKNNENIEQAEMSDLAAETVSFENSVRDILDKLAFDNLDWAATAIRELPIHDTARLRFIIDSIFEQAIGKSYNCKLYADLSNSLLTLRVPDGEGDSSDTIAFKTLVANKCQQLFDDDKAQESEDNTNESHLKFVACCRFIGELFNAHVLHVLIVIRCVRKLLTSTDDKTLECLYELLNVAGKSLSERLDRKKEAYAELFGKFQNLLDNEQCRLSTEMKTVLEGLIGTRNADESVKCVKPKTIHVHDAEKSFSADVQINSSQSHIDDEEDISTAKCTDSVVDDRGVPLTQTVTALDALQKVERAVAEPCLEEHSIDDPQCNVQTTSSLQHYQKPAKLNQNLKSSPNDAKRTQAPNNTLSNILNLLEHSNFDESLEKVSYLPINDLPALRGLVDTIFEKAIKKPENCNLYAKLCYAMQNITVRGGKCYTFRVLLINKCQQEFERNKDTELEMDSRRKVINSCADKGTKLQLKSILQKSEREFNRRSIANCRLIGELLNFKLLTTKILLRCVTKLLDSADELSLECLCALLRSAGKTLESELSHSEKKELDSCFEKMKELVENEKSCVPKKIKSILLDVISLKKCEWEVGSSSTPKAETDHFEKLCTDIKEVNECKTIETDLESNVVPKDEKNAEKSFESVNEEFSCSVFEMKDNQSNIQLLFPVDVQKNSNQMLIDTEKDISCAKSTDYLVTGQNVPSTQTVLRSETSNAEPTIAESLLKKHSVEFLRSMRLFPECRKPLKINAADLIYCDALDPSSIKSLPKQSPFQMPAFMQLSWRRGPQEPKHLTEQAEMKNKQESNSATYSSLKDDRKTAEQNLDLKSSPKNPMIKRGVLDSFSNILNKLKRANFTDLFVRIKTIRFDNFPTLRAAIDVIFEQVIKRPENCNLYAELCQLMPNVAVPDLETVELHTFRSLLINKCHQLIELVKLDELDIITSCSATVPTEENKLIFEQHKSVISCRFIGELFNSHMFTAKTMLSYVIKLLSSTDRLSLVCLCTLLKTVGKKLESNLSSNQAEELNALYEKIQDLIDDQNNGVPTEIKSMLQDVIHLKKNGWVFETRAPPKAETANNQKVAEYEMVKSDPVSKIIAINKTEVQTKLSKCETEQAEVKNEHQSSTATFSSLKIDPKPAKKNLELKSSSNDAEYTQRLLSSFSSILNNIRRDNFYEIVQKITTLPIINLPVLQGVIDLIFEGSYTKRKIQDLYAELCRIMQNIAVPDAESGNVYTFRQVLINKCHREFGRNKKEEVEVESRQKLIKSCTDKVTKLQFKLIFERSDREFDRRSLAIFRFICELSKLGITTAEITFLCVTKLISTPDNTSLECLCALLVTNGKILESELSASQKTELNRCYDKMQGFVNNQKSRVPLKIKLKLQDVINLKKRRWVVDTPCEPSTKTAGPACISLELQNSSPIPREKPVTKNVAQDISNKDAMVSIKKSPEVEFFKVLKSAFNQWIREEKIPLWFELMKFKLNPNKVPVAVSELIQYVMNSDPQKAEKCSKFFVQLIERRYIQSDAIVKGLGCLLATVENQQMSAELELVLSPLFESGYLQLDDLNLIFQNILDTNQSEEVNLQNVPASQKYVKNDFSNSQQKIPNFPVQKVVSVSSLSSFFDPFSSVTSSTSDLTVRSLEDDLEPEQVQQLIRDVLKKQTPNNFKPSEFKLQMKNIPFQRAAELQFMACCIIQMVIDNPDLYEFYVRLCCPIMGLTAEKKSYYVMLMKTCNKYFHQVLCVENDPSKGEQSTKIKPGSPSQNTKKEIEKAGMKGFCRFFSVLVNKMNNDTASTNVKRITKKLLDLRKIDFFCEIYNYLNKNDAHFEESIFESYIPQLLSSNELEIECLEMLKKVADDYTRKKFLDAETGQQQEQENQKSTKKPKHRNRSHTEDEKLQQNETVDQTSCVADEKNRPAWDETSTVSSSNLDTTLNSLNSSEESLLDICMLPKKKKKTKKRKNTPSEVETISSTDLNLAKDQVKPSTSNLKPVSSENLLESDVSYSTLPTDQSSDTVVNVVSSDNKSSWISHKEVSDTVADALNQLIAPRSILSDIVHRLTSMPISRESKLTNVIHLICNKAINDKIHGQQYVVLCEHLQDWSIIDKNNGKPASFKMQLIAVLYAKCNQIKLKIEEHTQNTKPEKEIPKELFERVIGYCRFLCKMLKSPVFGNEILICSAIELLSLVPIDKDVMELLNEFVKILRNDLDIKVMSFPHECRDSKSIKVSSQELEQHNLMFKIITLLQEVINFQKCEFRSSNSGSTNEGIEPSHGNHKNEIQTTQEQPQIPICKTTARLEELHSFLKMNPTIVDSIIERFAKIQETPAKVLDSIIGPMCESFYEKFQRNGKRDINEEFSYAIIFKSIHETFPSFEFLCINTVFDCVKKLNFPPGMMSGVFEFLFLYEIISCESFVQFKNVYVSEKISELVKMLNSSIFQNYKLSPEERKF